MGRVRPWSLAACGFFLLTGAAALSAALDGCVLPSFVLEVKPDAGPETGPPEAGPPPGCVSATYPDPPGGTDSTTDLGPLVFAIRSIDLGDMGDTPGYDLDKECTCIDDAGPSCTGRSTQLSAYCDAPGGVDNQAAKLFELIELPFGVGNFGSQYFSDQANQGNWSLLVQVKGYSGMPDDPVVEVALFPTSGIHPPQWNGMDKWPVEPSSLIVDGGMSSPRFVANGAYVSGGVLVATMPTTQITLAGSGQDTITITLSSGVITAKLVDVGGIWNLQGGVIAARWSLKNVFQALSSYRDNNGLPICSNSSSYAIAKGVICNDADILVDGTQPKSAPCDALSVGLGFTADPANLGSVSDAGITSPGCAPADDPANDSCP